jgi:hypothetical protein
MNWYTGVAVVLAVFIVYWAMARRHVPDIRTGYIIPPKVNCIAADKAKPVRCQIVNVRWRINI